MPNALLRTTLLLLIALLSGCVTDRVVTGGGFTPHGAHNIIEPLALKRPVIVGPEIHTIEYPAVEAIAAFNAGAPVRVITP